VLAHERLRPALARLDLGRRTGRPERPQPARLQRVDDPVRERVVGPDDRQVDRLLGRPVGQPVALARADRDQLGDRPDPGVARRAVERPADRALAQLPAKRVLAPAAADD
jgi:hypothetical protein